MQLNKAKFISVVGLGRLGASFAVVLASCGLKIIGVDINQERIKMLKKGKIDLYENSAQELFDKHKKNLVFTDNFKDAILNTDTTFIVVPTPSNRNHSFSLNYILDVCKKIASLLRRKTSWHLVVITSTINPKDMDSHIRPLLEKISGKKVEKDFGLCYSPEFIALGSVVDNLTHPDFILIGESDFKSGNQLAKLRLHICKNNPPVVRMNFVNAELTKLALNTYITTKISFANMLARICERLPNTDVDVVTSTLGLDSRIGLKYLKGAIGYGGPCFPRDNKALVAMLRKLKLDIKIPQTIDVFNQNQTDELINIIKKSNDKRLIIGILGLSYKPDTDVVEESQGILFAKKLVKNNYEVVVFDPVAINNAHSILKDSVKYAQSVPDCIDQSDILVIITPWKEFYNVGTYLLSRKKPLVVIDCWRMLKIKNNRIIHIPLGIYTV